MKPTENKRYVHLDGLRGILAIAVVIHHFAFAAQLHWFNKAWISVDAFFILSGFVIAHSYQSKIAQGMGLREFSVARINRLYPVYVVGLLLGILALITSNFVPVPPQTAQANAVVSGLLILPYLNDQVWPSIAGSSSGTIFPLNDPAWSLFFELFVNLLFFAWLRYGRALAPWLIAFAFLAIHIFGSQYYGLHSGWATSNFAGGFGRVTFFFFLGVVIYAAHSRINLRSTWLFGLGVLLLLAGFALKNRAIDYLLLFLIAPCTILLGSKLSADSAHAARLMTWLGGISYPLYITHYPIGAMLHGLLGETSAPLFVATSTVISIIAADGIARGEKWARAHFRQRRLA